MNTRNQLKDSALDIDLSKVTLDDFVKEFTMFIECRGEKRWRYVVGSSEDNKYVSSTYSSAKDAQKALEIDINELYHMLKSKAGKPE